MSMLERAQAWDLLCAWTPGERLRRHALAVEAVMRDLALRHGEDPERFGLAGLLHDADYEQWPGEHPARIVAWLAERGDHDLADAIAAHYTRWGHPAESLMARALLASDEISGLVMACARVNPAGLVGLTVASVQKKLRTPAFAAGVDRHEVQEGFRLLTERVGGTVEEHLQRILAALAAQRQTLEDPAVGPGF